MEYPEKRKVQPKYLSKKEACSILQDKLDEMTGGDLEAKKDILELLILENIGKLNLRINDLFKRLDEQDWFMGEVLTKVVKEMQAMKKKLGKKDDFTFGGRTF